MQEEFTIPYGSNRYCGPAALAYVTRTHPDEAAAHLRRIGNKRRITGVTNCLLLKAMKELGVQYQEVTQAGWRPARARPTLKQWFTFYPEGEYIVCITGHYIVIHGGKVFDNSYHLGKSIHVCPYLRKRVKAAWRIER